MNIVVSGGEIVDKYTILCIKIHKIQDEKKKHEVLCEHTILYGVATPIIKLFPLYYELLYHINDVIWDKTDEMKRITPQDDYKTFALLAHDIFFYNDRRFRLKRIFNIKSNIKEQKSYPDKIFSVSIPENMNHSHFSFKHIIPLIYSVMDYDMIRLYVRDNHIKEMVSQWIPQPFVSFHQECFDNDHDEKIMDITHPTFFSTEKDDPIAQQIIHRFVYLQIS